MRYCDRALTLRLLYGSKHRSSLLTTHGSTLAVRTNKSSVLHALASVICQRCLCMPCASEYEARTTTLHKLTLPGLKLCFRTCLSGLAMRICAASAAAGGTATAVPLLLPLLPPTVSLVLCLL
jgi:hypothetical protein